MKGVGFGNIDKSVVDKAKWLVLAYQQRLDLHIAYCSNKKRHHHWTQEFIWDNIPSVAAAKCLVGNIADHLEFFETDKCLLILPKDDALEDEPDRTYEDDVRNVEENHENVSLPIETGESSADSSEVEIEESNGESSAEDDQTIFNSDMVETSYESEVEEEDEASDC